MTNMNLFTLAMEARKYAYAPYSEFMVGACLMAKSGKLYKGCNIENSSFGGTNCAERTAFFKAVSQGERKFQKIAIAGGKQGEPLQTCPPCGICLQVMAEFCNPEEFEIIIGTETSVKSYLLKELLPMGFSLT